MEVGVATQLLRLVANQLKVGAALPFSVRDEHGKLLLARGQVLYNDHQLGALLARGLYVDQEELRLAREGKAGAAQPSSRQQTLFDLWEQATWHLDRLHKSLDGTPGFAERCDEFATMFFDLVQRDVDIAIFLSVRQDVRRLHLYGLTHALHTALVCMLMGPRLGWDASRTRTLVKAALTMNVAITDVQGRFAAVGHLTERQRDQIRAHPQEAAQALRAGGVDDEVWLRAVEQHHERAGGSGYPMGLQEVDETAMALRMADVFMAKVSPRVERAALSVQDAARQMYAEAQGHPSAAAIIKEYGIYPPGNVVKLASGELAVVIRRGATAQAALAAAVTDKAGMPVVHTARRDTSQPAYAIRSSAPDGPVTQRVPPERLYGLAH